MDKDLYKIMQEIKDRGNETKDVKYLGTISLKEETISGKIEITKDIFALVDVSSNGSLVIKYFDENQNFLAGRGADR